MLSAVTNISILLFFKVSFISESIAESREKKISYKLQTVQAEKLLHQLHNELGLEKKETQKN